MKLIDNVANPRELVKSYIKNYTSLDSLLQVSSTWKYDIKEESIISIFATIGLRKLQQDIESSYEIQNNDDENEDVDDYADVDKLSVSREPNDNIDLISIITEFHDNNPPNTDAFINEEREEYDSNIKYQPNMFKILDSFLEIKKSIAKSGGASI